MWFRIKLTKDGYFAQVKTGFFSEWKRIGLSSNGFDLFPESSDDYPLDTENDALTRCLDYKKSIAKTKSKPQYKNLSI